MKLTADTITDEQIRELSNSAIDGSHTEHAAIVIVRDCSLALDPDGQRTRWARARCAEILNARNEVKS